MTAALLRQRMVKPVNAEPLPPSPPALLYWPSHLGLPPCSGRQCLHGVLDSPERPATEIDKLTNVS